MERVAPPPGCCVPTSRQSSEGCRMNPRNGRVAHGATSTGSKTAIKYISHSRLLLMEFSERKENM